MGCTQFDYVLWSAKVFQRWPKIKINNLSWDKLPRLPFEIYVLVYVVVFHIASCMLHVC